MAAWEYGGSFLQRFDGAIWQQAPNTITVESGTFIDVRAWFRIVNGDEGITPGNLQIERRLDGGAWVNHGPKFNNMIPSFPPSNDPDIALWNFEMFDIWEGMLVELRLRTEWPGGPYYDAGEILGINVVAPPPPPEPPPPPPGHATYIEIDGEIW